MSDNKPYKPRVYSAWPVVVLLLFFGAASTLWSFSHILAIIVGIIGIVVYSCWDTVRTKIMQEEFSFRALFKNR